MDEVRIAQRIRTARKQAGLSQVALAERLGVTERTVLRWEGGSLKGVRLGKFKAIAGELGVTTKWLMHGDGFSTAR